MISRTIHITAYGIPNCDTVKKARVWLQAHHPDFVFHDFKKQGLDQVLIENWLEHIGSDQLINRKGTSWKALSDTQKQSADTRTGAIALMLNNPSLIKRPVLQISDEDGIHHVSVGFSDSQFSNIFSQF
ncbi:arsenate reductase [Undibacterium oligocarboniphilum]|uniref:Arsenate reductase n=1 Tax=Undibacterium oligocarboniphilum TaxID=666702 RepID=A0A850QGC7_9BURK|nr:arsenate reductase [Undibacterium oligocarboniphilum]MBC3870357.1 arsenate reductase [Undibacterium oligocarboniphilum]NVO78348.1 arsenate reductase [Undibacterium oligocarboniphilum]